MTDPITNPVENGLPEERPSSSLSCRSASSRIPRLTRSASLRSSRCHTAGAVIARRTVSVVGASPALNGVAASRSRTGTPCTGGSHGEDIVIERPAALFRSASFISSRGMNGLLSPSPRSPHSPISPHSPHSPHAFLSLPHSHTPQYGTLPRAGGRPLSFPLTPELPRRRFSYVSPYSRGYIAAERKAKSLARQAVPVTPGNDRQLPPPPPGPGDPPNGGGSQASSETDINSHDHSNDLDECGSVNSLDSCSLGSCLSSSDGHSAPRCGGAGSAPRGCEGRRSLSGVVHCGHNHEPDPDDYLTPTQRAARTIRALRGRLAAAERELATKDVEISSLNRQLVELRLSGADAVHTPEKSRSRQRQSTSKKSGSSASTASPAPSAATARTAGTGGGEKTCSSPSDDTSEPELTGLCNHTQLAGVPSQLPCPPPGGGSPASVSLADTNDSTELNRSLADSGHYDDLTSPATSARDDPFESAPLAGLQEQPRRSKAAPLGAPLPASTGPKSPKRNAGPAHPAPAMNKDDSKSCDEFAVDVDRSEDDEEDDEDDEEVSETDEDVEEEEEVEDDLDDEDDDEEEEGDEEWRSRIESEVEERLRVDHQRTCDRLKQEHMNEFHELKERHNDKVETLLSKLSDANLRYFELRPQLDRCQARIQQLEGELERAKDDLTESERRHQSTYLQMFLKGQQAARLQHESESASSSSGGKEGGAGEGIAPGEGGEAPLRGTEGTVKGLMRELAYTQDELRKLKAQKAEAAKVAPTEPLDTPRNAIDPRTTIDPAVTLQFLKSAIFYFLTDKDNAKGHLRAIISILGFNDAEKYTIVQVVKV